MRTRLTKENISSIKELYHSGMSTWEIGKKFKTSHSNILHHLKRFDVQRKNRSDAAKEGVKSGRIKIYQSKISNNIILNKDLAYVLGVLAGDGYVSYNPKRRNYQIGLSVTDKEFLEKFKKALFNIFKIEATFEFRKSRKPKWNHQYITRLCSKEACEFINSIGQFRKENWIIPLIIKNANNQIKSSFIQGFFDSEGEIDKKIGRVGSTSMNLEGLNEVGKLLNDLKIRYTLITVKDNRPNTHQKYRMRINDQISIINFYRQVGFTINRKKIVLEKFVNKWETQNLSKINVQ